NVTYRCHAALILSSMMRSKIARTGRAKALTTATETAKAMAKVAASNVKNMCLNSEANKRSTLTPLEGTRRDPLLIIELCHSTSAVYDRSERLPARNYRR